MNFKNIIKVRLSCLYKVAELLFKKNYYKISRGVKKLVVLLRDKNVIMNSSLTKAEEQVMQYLWGLGKGFVRDIVNRYDEPKPAYTTVATILKILEKKGFVNREACGNSYQYFPAVGKEEYSKRFLSGFVKNYFSSSYKKLVSFLGKNEQLSRQELEEIIEMLEKQVENHNTQDNE